MVSGVSSRGDLVCSCGALAAAAGFIALLGWGLGLPFLVSLGSGYIPMAPSTAMLFVLYGGASVLRARLPLHRGAYWLGVIVHGAGALVALLLFVLSYQGIYSDAEYLGFAAVGAVGGAPIGHMSSVSALGFLLASVSFLALSPFSNRPWRAVMAWGFACLLLVACAVLLLAYVYGTPLLYGGTLIPPAVTTCLAFAALGIALVALAGSQEWPGGESSAAAPAPGIFLVFILLAAGIITAGYLYSGRQEAHYRVQVEHELSSIAELKVSELVQYRRGRLGSGSIFLRNADFSMLVQRALDDPGDAEAQGRLREWLRNVRKHYQYDRTLLMDAHGTVQMAVPELTMPIASVIARRATEALRSGEVLFQDFYRDENDQRVYLTVLVPILAGPDGSRALGVLALCIDPETDLYPSIGRWPVSSKTAETLLVRRDGNDALFLNDLRFQTHAALSLRIPLARQDAPAVKAVLGQQGIVEGVDYNGQPVIAAVRRVPDSPWFLIARVAASEVYAPLRAPVWTLSALVAALLTAAGAGLWGVWRQRRVQFYKERAQGMEELRASEIRYRRLFEAAKDGVLILDADTGAVTDVNPFLIELLGSSYETFLGKKIWELGLFRDILTNQASFAELQQRESVRYDDRLLEAADGRRIDVEFVSNCYPVNHHKVIQCNIRDIRERKRSEEALQQAQAQLTRVLSLSPVVIYSLRFEGGQLMPVWVSDNFARITGYSKDEPLSLAWWVERVHPDDLAGLGDIASIPDEQAVHEYRFRRADGSYMWIRNELRIMRDSAGERIEMVGSWADITARKHAEEAVQRGDRRFRALIERSHDLVSINDRDGTYLYANPAHEAVYGLKPDELTGRRAFEFLHPDDVQKLVPVLAEAIRTGVKEASVEYRLRHKDGSWHAFDGIALNLLDDPDVAGILITGRDITERLRSEEARRQLEEQLRVAQKMEALGTLAGGIAHDFNNILGAIIGNAELARQDVGANRAALESLDEIRKASHRAQDLVQRILAFGRQHQEPQSVIPLRPVVEEALAFLRAILPTGVEIAATYDADAPMVRADSTQIHQVLINLCTNAWHAMEGNIGRIDIRLDGVTLDAEAADAIATLRPGRFARLSVTDTGTGMDAATLGRSFEPFFTTKPVGQGTGLGLSVVHGIVKVHGGAITVTSQPGRGTSFTLYFPAVPAPEHRPTLEDAGPTPYPAGSGQHVLYLDDEESLVFLVTRTLERLGYRVSGYTRTEEALAAVRADPERFDLVVTDLNMPGMSGLDVARALARLRPDLPVVLTSGYITDEGRAAAAEAGVREVIYKPNTVEELCAAVRRLASALKRP